MLGPADGGPVSVDHGCTTDGLPMEEQIGAPRTVNTEPIRE